MSNTVHFITGSKQSQIQARQISRLRNKLLYQRQNLDPRFASLTHGMTFLQESTLKQNGREARAWEKQLCYSCYLCLLPLWFYSFLTVNKVVYICSSFWLLYHVIYLQPRKKRMMLAKLIKFTNGKFIHPEQC